MTSINTDSIQSFVDKLKEQIDACKNESLNNNQVPDSFGKILQILSLDSFTSDIKTATLLNITTEDLKTVLEIIGLNEHSTKHYTNHLIEMQNEYKSETSLLSINFFKDLKQILKDYLMEYNEIHNNFIETINGKIRQYEKYIDLLTKKEFSELFLDFDALRILMHSLGVPEYDEWHISEYIGKMNLEYYESKVLDSKLVEEVKRYRQAYINESSNPAYKLIIDVIKPHELNIKNLVKEVKRVSSKLNLEYDLCFNTLSTILLDRMYEEYKNLVFSKSPDEKIDDIEINLNLIIENYQKLHNDIVLEAVEIVKTTREFYDNSLEIEGIDLESLVDLSLLEIQKNEPDLDKAIDLKTLPLIEQLRSTLESYEGSQHLSEDESKYLELLKELVGMYKELIEKKNELKKSKE